MKLKITGAGKASPLGGKPIMGGIKKKVGGLSGLGGGLKMGGMKGLK